MFNGGENRLKPGDVARVRVKEASGHVLRGSWVENYCRSARGEL